MHTYEIMKLLRRYLSAFLALTLALLVVNRAMDGIGVPDIVLTDIEEVRCTPTVVLDAGHGGEDCGAIGVNGVYEKDLNLTVTRMLAALLRSAGYQVVETRTADALLYDPLTVGKGQKKTTDLYNRLHISESEESAIFVSIHMNSFTPSPRQSGVQIWYGPQEEASGMATLIKEYIDAHLEGNRSRKLMKSQGSNYLLDRSTHPAILIECGFLSNDDECRKLSEESYQKELSFVLFCAMIEVLNQYGGPYESA